MPESIVRPAERFDLEPLCRLYFEFHEFHDGGHRLAKAWLLGLTEIQAVRFVIDPEPDYIIAEEAQP